MHHPGRPSSSTAQHVINMAGMDPGLGFAGSVGASGPGSSNSSSGHTAVQSSASANAALAANAAMMSSIPPGAYRNTPSQQHRNQLYQAQGSALPQQQRIHSPRAPGTLSPQTIGSPQHVLPPGSGFISPRSSQFPGGLSPPLSAGSAGSTANQQLARSQSLGHAAYQQYHHHQHPAAQSQQSSTNMPQMPLSPTAADMYSTSMQRRDRQQQYSDGTTSAAPSYDVSSSKAHAAASLLPTINTHIPSASLSANSPYTSPSTRQSFQMASTSPVASSAYGSPYGSSQQPHQSQYGASSSSGHSNRPMSMMDPAYGSSSSYAGAQVTSPSSHANKRASMSHMTGLDSTILPLHHSPQLNTTYPDSLPLYTTGATSQAPSSPHMPVSPAAPAGRLVGAPPRTSIGNIYTTTAMSSEQDLQQRLQGDNKATMSSDGTIRQNRERRGTVSGPDRLSARSSDFEAWDRRQRAQKRRLDGFRRVRDMSDLKIILEPAQQGKGRRADPTGGYVSPLKAMTAYLHHTYHLVNPAFFYELSFNPRRVLTKPSRPMHNDGHDNEDSDYILYVNDWLGSEESNRYLILDILGQGTFGQVVKCQNMKTREIVAVKVIKNKPAYFNQSMMEVTILEMLNGNWDPNDEHHILRLRDTFIHAKHLCLVFELLSSNLYELIKQNSFRGLSTSLVRVFTTQLLDALTVLHEARLIHCDLKPENILLKTLQTPSIKLVDFGSACHERQTVYTYIQSRFYRSPEVLLGLPYNAAIDMWSLGCIAIELFLGLPLFPGTSEYNQICRIVEMLGLPPQWMLEQGKQTAEFFNMYSDEYGRRQYKLKSLEQYSKEHNVQEQPSKRYFQATTLPDIVKTYPMSRKSGRPADVQKEMTNRTSFIDFVTGLLHMDPNQRWTPEQAKLHPFITTEKFTQPFRPPVAASTAIQRSSARPSLNSSNSGSSSERHPFGGLPESSTNRQGSRTYQDAAAYNQHLIQQQAYNQAHVARQNQINNPYARADSAAANAQAQVAATQAQLAHAQAHAAQLHAATMSPSKHQIAGQQQQQQFESGRQSASTHSGNRSRSDTLTRMDVIPPQLARMGLDPPAHSMTPVLKREENLREWERQQQGGLVTGGSADRVSESKGKARDHQHLDLLNQQAEQNQHGHGQWPSQGSSTSSQQNFRQATAGNAMPFSVVVDGSQRQQVARGDHLGSAPIMAPPPAAYAAKQSANAAAGLSFDPYQPDSGQGGMSLQPSQYHTIGHTASTSPSLNSHMRLAGGQGAVANRHSIAVPHMSQSTLQGNSLASLQNLYNGPNDGNSGYVQQPPQPAAVATMLPVNANAANSSNIRNDGFGGLSDLMFGSNPGGGVVPVGGGAASTQRYSMLPNGALTSSHAIQPPHSPLENTAAFAPYHANSTSSHR